MRHPWQYATLLFILTLTLFGSLSYWFWLSEKSHSLEETETQLSSQLTIRAARLKSHIDSASQDVLLLAGMPPIQGIARAMANNGLDIEQNSTLTLWQDRLNSIFFTYASNNPAITQVRFIGRANEGKELVRVNRAGPIVSIVSPKNLQIKGYRDYYLATSQLNNGQIYISPINLNRESGQIQQPEIPTIRISTPIFFNQKFFGMVIINIAVADILDDLQYDLASEQQLYLSNANGDFLSHPDRSKTFAFERGTPLRWQQEFNIAIGSTEQLVEIGTGQDAKFMLSYRFVLNDADSQSAPYYLSMSMPKSKVLVQVFRQLLYFIAMLLTLACAVAAFIYLFALNLRRSREIELLNNSLESQVKARTAELEHATAAKSDFIANMSHEIRTPMNAILGMLQLLHTTPLNARQQDYTHKAEIAAQALLNLLNDILDYSKMAANRLQLDVHQFDLHELLRNIGIILSSNVNHKPVEILFNFSPTLPIQVIGDALRLQQVLLNLAGNALKFTEHGQVVISVNELSRSGQQTRLTFDVTDSGIGISTEQWQTIFDEFAQAETSTSRKYGGTGLGLAISRRLTRLMGAELEGHSEPGKGSSFYFTITLDIAEASTQPQVPAKPLNVLIVDDNALAREILQQIVEHFGWTAQCLPSGEKALEILEQDNQPIDILLIDWQMPGLNGLETCLRIKALAKDKLPKKIIMITAYGRELLSQYSEQDIQVLDDFLIKPITPSMLFDAVNNIMYQSPFDMMHRDLTLTSLQGINILLVEDNLTNQQVAVELLQNLGAKVHTALNGQIAIETLNSGLVVDIILMDVHMPVMDGYQCTALIRQQLGLTQLPILALTANAMLEDKDAAIVAGMNDHIAKPFNLTSLCETILRWVNKTPQQHNATSSSRSATTAPMPVDKALVQFAQDAGINLSTALKNVVGNETLLCRALILCRQELASSLDTLQSGNNDIEQQRHILHTLKGMLATIGAEAFSRWCSQQEQLLISSGQALNQDDFHQLLVKLQHLVTKIDSLVELSPTDD